MAPRLNHLRNHAHLEAHDFPVPLLISVPFSPSQIHLCRQRCEIDCSNKKIQSLLGWEFKCLGILEAGLGIPREANAQAKAPSPVGDICPNLDQPRGTVTWWYLLGQIYLLVLLDKDVAF